MSSHKRSLPENDNDDDVVYQDKNVKEIKASIHLYKNTSPEIIVEKGSIFDCFANFFILPINLFFLIMNCSDQILHDKYMLTLLTRIFFYNVPQYDYINEQTEIIYKSILRRIFEMVNEWKMKSVSVPVFGYEQRGYPPSVLAKIFDESVKSYLSRPFNGNDTLETIRIIVDSENQILIDTFSRYFKQFQNCNLHKKAKLIDSDSSVLIQYELIYLKPNSEEFIKVKNHFLKTMNSDTEIHSIQLVKNSEFETNYDSIKKEMHSRPSNNMLVEYNLFHGTSLKSILSICERGFDRRYIGVNETVYGDGFYFAREAKYSHFFSKRPFERHDNKNEYSMLLAKVLVGTYQDYQSNLATGSRSDGFEYDSVVDDRNKPDIFVVSNQNKVLPHYIIKYSTNF